MTDKTVENIKSVLELAIFAGFAYGVYQIFVSLL